MKNEKDTSDQIIEKLLSESAETKKVNKSPIVRALQGIKSSVGPGINALPAMLYREVSWPLLHSKRRATRYYDQQTGLIPPGIIPWGNDSGTVSVSLPFRFGGAENGVYVPAVGSLDALRLYNRTGQNILLRDGSGRTAKFNPLDFPRVLLTVEDYDTLVRGDEVVSVQFGGQARRLVNTERAKDVRWRPYESGLINVNAPNENPRNIPSRELTIPDVVDLLESGIGYASNNLITVERQDLKRAIVFLRDHTPGLEKRIDQLTELLKFRDHFMFNRAPLFGLLSSMIVGEHPESFRQIKEDADYGEGDSKINSFSDFLRRIDEISQSGEKYQFGGGASVPILVYYAGFSITPGEDIRSKFMDMAPSVIFELYSLKAINAVMGNYLSKIQPRMVSIANESTKVQELMLETVEEYVKQNQRRWQAIAKALPAIRAKVEPADVEIFGAVMGAETLKLADILLGEEHDKRTGGSSE